MNARANIALSGTPIENSVTELKISNDSARYFKIAGFKNATRRYPSKTVPNPLCCAVEADVLGSGPVGEIEADIQQQSKP